MGKDKLKNDFRKLGLFMNKNDGGKYEVTCDDRLIYTFENLKVGIKMLEEEKRRIKVNFYSITEGEDLPRKY